MKIKFLQGGVFTPPFAVYQPFIVPYPEEKRTTASKKSSDNDNDIKMKDIYGLLDGLKEAIPGDITAVSSKLGVLFNNIENKLNSSESSLFGGTGSIASEYIQILNIVNNLKFQHKAFEDAKKISEDRKSLSEVVINSTGKIMVTDGEGFDWITPEEYFKNKEDYSPITNALLLDFRAKGVSGLAFNYNSLEAVAGSIGMEDITKMINDAISDLLSDSVKETGYTESKKLLQGLEDYLQAKEKSGNYDATVEDLYKGTLLTENLARSAKQALTYIYNSLPTNALTLLKMKSDGTTKGALQLIDSLVYSKTKTKNEFDLDLEGGISKDSKKSDTEEVTRTFVMEVLAGRGAHIDEFVLNNESNNAIKTDMDVYGGVVKLDGNYAEKSSVTKMLKDSGLISIMIGKVGYFGNLKVNLNQMEDLLYDGGSFARIELPVSSDNSPRFDLLEKMDKFEKRVKLLGEDPVKLLQSEEFKDLKTYFDKEGNKRTSLFKPFLIFNAVTSEGLLKIDEKNSFVTDKESDAYYYDDIKYYLSKDSSNPDRYLDLDDLDLGEFFTLGQYDHIYKGTLYIPIGMNKEAAAIGSKRTIKNDNLELEYQLSLKDYNTIDIANLNN